jgi:hypothetical protein
VASGCAPAVCGCRRFLLLSLGSTDRLRIAEGLHAPSVLSFRQEKGFHDLLTITGGSCCYPTS